MVPPQRCQVMTSKFNSSQLRSGILWGLWVITIGNHPTLNSTPRGLAWVRVKPTPACFTLCCSPSTPDITSHTPAVSMCLPSDVLTPTTNNIKTSQHPKWAFRCSPSPCRPRATLTPPSPSAVIESLNSLQKLPQDSLHHETVEVPINTRHSTPASLSPLHEATT